MAPMKHTCNAGSKVIEMLTDEQMNDFLIAVANKDEVEIAAQVFNSESVLREVIRLIATHPEKLQNIGGPIRAVQKVHTVEGDAEDQSSAGSIFNVEVALATSTGNIVASDGIPEVGQISASDMEQQEPVLHQLKQPETLFSCPHCDREFVRVFELQRHITCRHTAKKNFECQICGAKFALKVYLSYHMRAKHCPDNEKPFACDQCDYRCIQKAILQRHMLKHQNAQKYICPVCNASFHRHITLKRHMYGHKEKNLSCDRCEYKTADPYRLRNHIRLHDMPDSFHCSLCEFKCKEKTRLVRHMECHSDEKNYPCQKCDLVFKRPGNLKRHQYVHSEKNLICDTCNYKTADPYELKRHLRVHIEGKKHVCEICHFRFSRIYDLKKHRKVHERSHQCPICLSTFAHPRELTNHKRRRHGGASAKVAVAAPSTLIEPVPVVESENVVVISSSEDFLNNSNQTFIQENADGDIEITDQSGQGFTEVVLLDGTQPSVDQKLLEIASAIIAEVDEPKTDT